MYAPWLTVKVVFCTALFIRDQFSPPPREDEIERPDEFLDRIRYIIDYATGYYCI